MKNGTVSVFGEAIEMTAKERAHLIKLLQDSQKEYLSYVENVSEAQWNWKPGQDRWSVGETAEHILLAEGSLFSAMDRAVAAPRNPDWEKSTAGRAELLERALLDRNHKAVSPESIRPQGLSKNRGDSQVQRGARKDHRVCSGHAASFERTQLGASFSDLQDFECLPMAALHLAAQPEARPADR